MHAIYTLQAPKVAYNRQLIFILKNKSNYGKNVWLLRTRNWDYKYQLWRKFFFPIVVIVLLVAVKLRFQKHQVWQQRPLCQSSVPETAFSLFWPWLANNVNSASVRCKCANRCVSVAVCECFCAYFCGWGSCWQFIRIYYNETIKFYPLIVTEYGWGGTMLSFLTQSKWLSCGSAIQSTDRVSFCFLTPIAGNKQAGLNTHISLSPRR